MPFTTEICQDDVKQVAEGLGIHLTQRQIDQVRELYDTEAASDPTATWNLIIENIIYNIIK